MALSTDGLTATTASMLIRECSRHDLIWWLKRSRQIMRSAHTASLGLTFYQGNSLPKRFSGGAFIGQHGSWNRQPRSGYKVIFVPFASGQPVGSPEDILTAFVNDDGDALGRPVGVVVDKAGALLVADDVGNVIWRVTPAQAK